MNTCTKTHPNNVRIYNAIVYYTTLLRYNSAHFVLPHEYNDRVGLSIQNRMTSRYVPGVYGIETLLLLLIILRFSEF